MNSDIDLTFYHAVKKKFSPRAGVTLFVSSPEGRSVGDLVAEEFDASSKDAFHCSVDEHFYNKIPYFVIDACVHKISIFFYACAEFLREEEYDSGKIKEFSLNPFRDLVVDIEMLKKELAGLKGDLLVEDKKSKAS